MATVAATCLFAPPTRQHGYPPRCALRSGHRHVAAARRAHKVFDETVVEPRGVRDYIELSRELIRPDGGPPRWFSPVECGGSKEDTPLLLYLPGIDGSGAGLIRHHQRLGKIFDVWCLHIPVMDRTSFEGLVEYVEIAIRSNKPFLGEKPIYLVGESIGACIALAVAAQNPEIDLILVLANPATSFSKSQLWYLATFLDSTSLPLNSIFSPFFGFIPGDSMRMAINYVESELSLHENFMGLSKIFNDIMHGLLYLGEILPAESLHWKLKMIRTASYVVNSRLHAVKAQTLIVSSGRDQLLPNWEEAKRLSSLLPHCRIRHFEQCGHNIFLEDSMDLVSTIKKTSYYRRSRQIDYVSDYLLPTRDEFKHTTEKYRWVDIFASPVMLSTLEDGKIVKGLAGIPSEGPALLVGYHMLLGLELSALIETFAYEKQILVRGIAHPFMFEKSSEQLMLDHTSFDGHRIVGAVPVSAANFYKLFSEKSFVLLYPGGAREALHRKGEDYKLFWPERAEFVRMASRFGATIIPFGAVGEDDLFKMLLDYEDLRKIPFYDILDKKINSDNVKLRTDLTNEVANQSLYPPILMPKIPGRIYYLFGKPIETRGRKEELREKEKAHQLYMHVKSEVENCLVYLKSKREEDPYRHVLCRFLYQMANGFEAEIPTFEH